MFISKQKYILILVFLLFPSAVVYSAWSEPSQAPTGGNVSVPVYSQGTGQTLDGTLHVGTPGSYATALQGSGSVSGIQGNSVGNALFGNLTANGAGGGRALYGLAVDAADYGVYTSGGLGVGVASGDVWFLQQDQGIAWPRESDGASLYGVYVTNTGELQVRGHGGGINLMNQNTTSLLTVSEAGAVNVVTGPLTVTGKNVCLADGTNCPAPPAPPAGSNLWLPNGNDIYPNFTGDVKVNHGLFFNGDTAAQAIIDFDPYQGNLSNYFLIRSGVSATYGERNHFRIDRNTDIYLGGNTYFGNQDVTSLSPINYGLAIKSGDIYVQNNKSIRVDDAGANTTVLIGNYLGGGAGFGYGTFKTASLAVEGDLKGNQLCIQEDCKSSWGQIVAAGNGAYWALTGSDLYPSNANYNIGIGNSAPGAYKLNVTGNANVSGNQNLGGNLSLGSGGTLDSLDASNFYINGQGDVQIRVDTNNNGANSFKINNGTLPGGTTVFSVDESGNLMALGNATVSGQNVCRQDGTNCPGGSGVWAVSGANIYNTNAGNVGIGTNLPGGYKLNVNGLMAIQGGTLDSTLAGPFYFNANKDFQIRLDTDNNDLTQESFSVNNGNNVTVFTVNESGFLSVRSTDDTGARFTVAASSPQFVGIGSDLPTSANNGDILFFRGAAVAGLGGKIGVAGSASPASLLGLYGNASIGAGYYASAAPANGLIIEGNTGIGTNNPGTYKLNVNGNLALGTGGVLDSLDASNFYINGQGDVQIRLDTNNNGNNSFKINNGSPPGGTTIFSVDEGGNVRDANAYCLGANCKSTNWGPNTGNTFERSLQAVDGLVYDCTRNDVGVAQVGYVMIGIRNTNPAKLICARMW